MTNEHITTTNELSTINSTLNLSENDAAELDKLNNADLLNNSTLNQLNLAASNSQETGAACTSSTNHHHNQQESPDSPITIIKTINLIKPLVISSRRTANRRNTNTESISSTTNVKEEPVVVIDDKDNSSLIDLTKENDDVMILSAEESGLTSVNTIRNRSNRSNRLLSRRIVTSNNTSAEIVPTTSASSSSIVDSVTVSELNSDMDIIQEVLSTTESRFKLHRPYLEFTYHVCNRNNNNIINNNMRTIANSHILRRPNRNNLNSTIILDDDNRNEFSTDSILTNSLDTLSATIQPVDLPQSSLLQTTDQTTSHSIENSPKRLRLDRTSKKDNQKAIPNKQATNSNETSTASSIHCPICLETLDELKSHNKRLKTTYCGHILCNICLDATFKSNSDGIGHAKSIFCPTCRTKLTKTKIHDLFL